MAKKVAIVFRYDDYAASLGEATSEREAIECQFLAAFQRQGVPLLVGVVPDLEGKRLLSHDPARLSALRDAVLDGCVEAALHGLTHEALSRVGNADSEFVGQPREAQLERLRAGKLLLDEWLGTPVTTFIPPWNTYDDATVDALAEAGFTVISAGLAGPAVAEPMLALPHTTGLADLRATVRGLVRRAGRSLAVCMFHHFSFAECSDPLARAFGQMSIAGLDTLLAWCRAQPDVELLTASQAAESYRAELTDGRVDAAIARWQCARRWRRTPVLGRVMRWLWAPKALVPPKAAR